MPDPWSAERKVSADLARGLIERQFADLSPVDAELLGVGWDNTAFRINGQYVFRFPRRPIAVDLIRIEGRVLPQIAGRVPLSIPVPSYAGTATEEFPWPFAGYPMLEGSTACRAALDDAQRMRLAEPLARFLRALHAIPVEGLGLGQDTLGRLDLQKRVPILRRQIKQLSEAGLIAGPGRLAAVVDDVPQSVQDCNSRHSRRGLVHGDLYSRHLLVDGRGDLSGVIDWGDAHCGDVAVDLAVAHLFLPPAAREVFHETYGAVDERTWMLARFRALSHTAAVALYSHAIGDGDLLRESLLALTFIAGN